MKKQKILYYRLDSILEKNAHYNMIFGERSNGKTYAVIEYALERFIKHGEQFAIIRRWQDDFKGKRGATMFDNLITNGVVEKLSEGKWSNIYYYSSRWYLSKFEDDKRIIDETPFAFAFAISAMEHDKSTSYPNIKNVLFDEFLTRGTYIPDEFIKFMNVLSTIIRQRNDVKIFMCGNAVNKYSPYFAEMGLHNVKNMKQGDIELYNYGDSGLKVAVEFSDSPNKGKPSDIYFAFNNSKLEMIKGSGGIWEIDIYPHLPLKYKPKDIIFTYFIIFSEDILQCEIIIIKNNVFAYIHRKTTELKNIDKDLIYSTEYDVRPNWKRKITKPITPIEKKIATLFLKDKVFYQDNEVGEIVRNYLMWCKKGE